MSRSELPKKAVQALTGYLRKHPEELLRQAKNAASLKFGLPLSALRWVIREIGGSSVPDDLELIAKNPGIFASASMELMETSLRASATVIVDSVDFRTDALLVEIRLNDIELKVLDENAGTPIAALLQSGSLDLSRPGDLLSYLPKRPEVIVATEGNRLTLDLMKHPQLSRERAKKLVALLVPLVAVDAIRTDGEHLDVSFAALPFGAGQAFDEWKKLF
jgi:hypothetical protein